MKKSKSNKSTPKTQSAVLEVSETVEQAEKLLVPTVSQIVSPVVSPERAKQSWDLFQATKKALLDETDYQVITTNAYKQGRWISEKKPFVKKAGWRKLATAFNLSDTVVKETRVAYEKMPFKDKEGFIERPGFVWEMTVRAIAPNGRYAEGVGSCASNERGFAHLEHDVRATAMTRAKNRAISDLIGGGEVSAEEMSQQEENKQAKQEDCTIDHEQIETRTVVKEGKNTGRPYKYCSSCGWGKWEDTQAVWSKAPVKKEEPKEEVKSEIDEGLDKAQELVQQRPAEETKQE